MNGRRLSYPDGSARVDSSSGGGGGAGSPLMGCVYVVNVAICSCRAIATRDNGCVRSSVGDDARGNAANKFNSEGTA